MDNAKLKKMTPAQLRALVQYLEAQNVLLHATPDIAPVKLNWVSSDAANPAACVLSDTELLQFPRYVLYELSAWAAAIIETQKAAQYVEMTFPGEGTVPPMVVTFVKADGPTMADIITDLRKEIAELKAAQALH